MRFYLRNVKRDILNENTDDLLFMMIDHQMKEMRKKNLEPNRIQLTIFEHDEFHKMIWLAIVDEDCFQEQESIWINEYNYAFNEVDETPLAKQEVYRLKKILKKHYQNLQVSTDLRGC